MHSAAVRFGYGMQLILDTWPKRHVLLFMPYGGYGMSYASVCTLLRLLLYGWYGKLHDVYSGCA